MNTLLSNVETLKYSPEQELILKKGERALLTEGYMAGDTDLGRFEIRKAIVEKEIEVLLRILHA